MKIFLPIATILFLLSSTPNVEATRRLLSERKSHGIRGSDWTEEQNWSISKFAKDAVKTVESGAKTVVDDTTKAADSVADDMKKAVDAIGKDAEDFIGDAVHTVENALAKPFIARTSDLFDDIKSDVTTGWQKLIAGFDSVDDYIKNQFQKDLQWIAKELVAIWDFVCEDSPATEVVTIGCSAGLSAAACAAMDGMAPFCGVGTLLEKLISSALKSVIKTVLTCTVYYSVKDLPIEGWCDGIAYSVSALIADVFELDPFTPVCNAAVNCACGDCPFTCGSPVSPTCELSTYESAMEELISELSTLLAQ